MSKFIEQLVKEEIKRNGKVVNEDVLKVDNFLNQQVDPLLMQWIGKGFAEHFQNKGITKVITVEASGIAPAIFTALELMVPLVICKKSESITLSEDYYSAEAFSFTHGNLYHMIVSQKFINDNDNFLLVDDFLASGEATMGLVNLIRNTNAKIAGAGIVIEKTFMQGRKILEAAEVSDIYSLAKVKSLKNNTITFE